MENMAKRMEDQERIVRELSGLTKELAKSHLALSASCRRDKTMIRELKENTRELTTARYEQAKWLRDHEVRLRSHYKGLSDLKDKLR